MLEGELFAFLERTADAAFAVTDSGEIRFWNKAAEKLFGYSAAEVLNRSCREILDGRGTLGTPACSGDRSVQHCAAQNCVIPDFDLEVKTKSGERLWVNVSTVLFEDTRRTRQLVVHMARDISRRKKNEELLSSILDFSRQLASAAGRTNGTVPVSPLSEQERRVLRLFANARNSAEIARELGITLPTLRNHLHSINEKLHTHNRLEAVMHALKRGLI
ncbi:MAG TPA: PAS domain S-box protein [Bryobacteraceae bacterium]|nr:PAS domain S-box protein [Bryobacteraceae bacterium]